MIYRSKREKFDILGADLMRERSSFEPAWRDLGDFYYPTRIRFSLSEGNRGDRRNQKIIDSTGTIAADTLSAGMMAGITSPARPWFGLTTPDPRMAEIGAVEEWLELVGDRMNSVFLRSNLYNILPVMYGDMGVFGTGAILVEEDFEQVLRLYSIPVGTFCIANDSRMRVRVFYREIRMTVRQVVEKFGKLDPNSKKIDWSNMSSRIKECWENGNKEEWVEICHYIGPNDDYDSKSPLSRNKKFASCYFEKGVSKSTGRNANYLSGRESDMFLRESGYDYFPVLCPRWKLTGDDVYATWCPGMAAIGDVKQLQHGEKKALKAIDQQVEPALYAPTEMRNEVVSGIPGSISYGDDSNGRHGVRRLFELNFDHTGLEAKQQQVRQRINRVFFADLFLMLANAEDITRTATEIAERKEEKLLAIGPVLEQLNQDVLDPLIDITFLLMGRQSANRPEGLLPPPPEELQGVDLRVDYKSIMANAQKIIGISSIERFTNYAVNLATVFPEIKEKLAPEEWIEQHAAATGVSTKMIRTSEEFEKRKAAIAQSEQATRSAAMMKEGAGAARDLASADLSGDNALTRILQTAQAGQVVPG